MREFVKRARSDDAALLQDFEVGVPGDLSESENRLGLQDFQLSLKVGAAIRNFTRKGLVVRRRTTAGGRGVDAIELQAIVAVERSRLIREAGFVQRGVEKVARTVTREHSPGTVRSMSCGSEPQNQQLGLGITKSWNRLAPVFPSAIGAALFARDLLAILYQARALGAGDNLIV